METKGEGEGQTVAKVEEPAKTETPSAEQVLAELSALRATNQRLLKESQENKQKAKSLLSEKENKEKDDLEGKEKFKEAYQMALKKLQDKDLEISKMRKVNINKTIDVELAKYASDAHNIDDVKKFLPVDLLDIVEENDDIKIHGLKEAVDATRKERTYLFKTTSQAKVMTAKPGATRQEPLDLQKVDRGTLARALSSLHKN